MSVDAGFHAGFHAGVHASGGRMRTASGLEASEGGGVFDAHAARAEPPSSAVAAPPGTAARREAAAQRLVEAQRRLDYEDALASARSAVRQRSARG